MELSMDGVLVFIWVYFIVPDPQCHFIGMSRKEFSEHTGIPVRTLEDWEAARRTPPEYIPRLIAYQLKYEELVKDFANRVEFDGVKSRIM